MEEMRYAKERHDRHTSNDTEAWKSQTLLLKDTFRLTSTQPWSLSNTLQSSTDSTHDAYIRS